MRVMHNGKIIGNLEGKTLIKSGRQVVLMRSMDGFGIPKEIVEEELKRDSDETIESVEIHYLNKIYRAPLELFFKNGISYYRPPYEPQYILSRRFFSIEDSKQATLI